MNIMVQHPSETPLMMLFSSFSLSLAWFSTISPFYLSIHFIYSTIAFKHISQDPPKWPPSWTAEIQNTATLWSWWQSNPHITHKLRYSLTSKLAYWSMSYSNYDWRTFHRPAVGWAMNTCSLVFTASAVPLPFPVYLHASSSSSSSS